MTKVLATMDLKGKAYAKVPTRIKEFRQDCPNGDIKTSYVINADQVVFTAYILKDKSNPNSASATGHAIGKLTGDKAFEKLETIAIGRALAILGYMASGEVASSEEMESFNAFKVEKKNEAIEKLGTAKTLEELKTYFMALGSLMADEAVIAKKDEMKTKLK